MTSTGTNKASQTHLDAPRFENGRDMIVAGVTGRFDGPDVKNISALWQRFVPFIGNVPNEVGQIAYGLCSSMVSSPFSFDYTVGVEVSKRDGLPREFTVLNIPAMRYAIFTHRGQISDLCITIDAIYHQWLPVSGHSFRQPIPDVPYMIERYDQRFSPQTGSGEVELWIPIKD